MILLIGNLLKALRSTHIFMEYTYLNPNRRKKFGQTSLKIIHCWETQLTNHPTNRTTEQLSNQPADRPTDQLQIGHKGLNKMPKGKTATLKLRLGRKNMAYTRAQKSPLSGFPKSVSPKTHDQVFVELS